MASTILGAAGKSIGFAFGGPIGAAIGGAIGGAIGAAIDSAIMRALAPDRTVEGPKVTQVGLSAPREGQPLARGYGAFRCEGRHIWPADPRFTHRQVKTKTRNDGKGGGSSTTTVENHADLTFAVAICEGPIAGIRRVWADGNLIDLAQHDFTLYYGTADQDPDPTMEGVEGAGNVPDYRGIAYIVFRDLRVTEHFHGRAPQFSFEVFRGAQVAAAEAEGLPANPWFLVPWDDKIGDATPWYGFNRATQDVNLLGDGKARSLGHGKWSIILAIAAQYRAAGRGADEFTCLFFKDKNSLGTWSPAGVQSASFLNGFCTFYKLKFTADAVGAASLGSLLVPAAVNGRTGDVLDAFEELERQRDVVGETISHVFYIADDGTRTWSRTYSEGGGEPANASQLITRLHAIADSFKAGGTTFAVLYTGSQAFFPNSEAPTNGWRQAALDSTGRVQGLHELQAAISDVASWWLRQQVIYEGGAYNPALTNAADDAATNTVYLNLEYEPYSANFGTTDDTATLFSAKWAEGFAGTPFTYGPNDAPGLGGVGLLGVQEFSTDVKVISATSATASALPFFVSATTVSGDRAPQNANIGASTADFLFSIDHLQAQFPAVKAVKIPVTWYGDDLRAGVCQIKPKTDIASKTTTPDVLRIAGLTRSGMAVVSTYAGKPAFATSPNDASIIRAILNLKARGYKVILEPVLALDIAAGNGLPDPYGGAQQEAYPRRRRVTVTPAIGQPGTVDKTAAAATQIADFFGTATAAQFSTAGEVVTFTGSGWRYRRFALHVAALGKAAGGVDGFLLGSDMAGITRPRSSATAFPAAGELAALAAEVKTLIGGAVKVSYAAATGELAAYAPNDGSGDVLFALDGFYAAAAVDFVAVHWREPLADWRDLAQHADAALAPAIYALGYLGGNVEAGENYDWRYVDAAARAAQARTPIADAAYSEPWVFRSKDVRAWRASAHHDRPGGVRSGTPTAWVAGSKPLAFFTACPAIEKAANGPDVELDPKTGRASAPPFSNGARDDDMQRAYHRAFADHWRDDPAVLADFCCVEGWDARPWPAFAETDAWADAALWQTGDWISGRAMVLVPEIIRAEAAYYGIADLVEVREVLGGAQGFKVEGQTHFRGVIEPIRGVWQTVFSEEGGKIVAESLLLKPVAATYAVDADAVPLEGDRRFERPRAAVEALPRALWLTAVSASRDYSTETAPSFVDAPGARREIRIDAPLVMDSALIDQRAAVAHQHEFVGRDSRRFGLPPSALLRAAPGALVAVDFGRGPETLLVESRDVAAGLKIEARAIDKGALRPIPVSRKPVAAPAAVAAGDVIPAHLDLPMMTAGADPLLGYVAASRNPWAAMAVHRSTAPETGFEFVKALPVGATMGVTTTTLPAGRPYLWDRGTVLGVRLFSGELVTRSDAEVYAGANALAIHRPGADPRDAWEIVQFANAALAGPGQYNLTRLLRGQRDTGAQALAAGSLVVVLDSALHSAEIGIDDVGVAYYWRTGPASLPASDPAFALTQHAYIGRGRLPFAPVRARAEESAGDLVLTWIRQDRDPGADSWVPAEIPMTEAALAFEVDILEEIAGPAFTLKRTLATATEAATYLAADRAADAIPAGKAWADIYQISAAAGRGAALRLNIG